MDNTLIIFNKEVLFLMVHSTCKIGLALIFGLCFLATLQAHVVGQLADGFVKIAITFETLDRHFKRLDDANGRSRYGAMVNTSTVGSRQTGHFVFHAKYSRRRRHVLLGN
jgi:hypothetical protein